MQEASFEQLENLFLTGDETNIQLALQIAKGLLQGAVWTFASDWEAIRHYYNKEHQKPQNSVAETIRAFRAEGLVATDANTVFPEHLRAAQKLIKTICLLPNSWSKKFQELPPLFECFTEVETAIFKHNQLTQLPDFVWNWTKLKKLDLIGNDVRYLPKALANLQQLEVLKISSAGYIEIDAAIAQLPQLQYLHYNVQRAKELQANWSFPEALFISPYLKELALNGGYNLQIPNNLVNLPSLEKLYLFELCEYQFPSSICNLDNVKEVHILSYKEMKKLPEFLFQLPNLEQLHFQNFHLAPSDFVDEIINFKKLKHITYKKSIHYDKNFVKQFKQKWIRKYPQIELIWMKY